MNGDLTSKNELKSAKHVYIWITSQFFNPTIPNLTPFSTEYPPRLSTTEETHSELDSEADGEITKEVS